MSRTMNVKRGSREDLDKVRMGETVEDIQTDILENLFCVLGKFPEVATVNDKYFAVAATVRDRLLHKYLSAVHTYSVEKSRTVVYLSAEYLLGPQLENNLVNLRIYENVKKAVERIGWSFDDIIAAEEEPGLGNGGLGRLAACYMDSLATLEIPAIGYGIRYEFGIFDQIIKNGWQMEVTDKWLRFGNPWEIAHPEIAPIVKFGGKTEQVPDGQGGFKVVWNPEGIVRGVPHDTAILGYGVNNANMLRLWRSEACESFDFHAFNTGDYYKAVSQKVVSENITKVLYPNDEPESGKLLRLEQQYFFVSCALQDLIRIYKQRMTNLEGFDRKYVIQLNDTHPSIAVAELMRLLVDDNQIGWERAWEITTNVFAFTNHTLLPEALEKWPVRLFGRLLPRHLEIIYEINRRFLEEVAAKFPGDKEKVRNLSLFEEGPVKKVRMANLASVGSRAINGVAELHTRLLKQTVLKDFYEMWPQKFYNVTNGVTPRRFMLVSNPGLSELIMSAIGPQWVRSLTLLRKLDPYVEDKVFREKWRAVKLDNKRKLAVMIKKVCEVDVDPESMFDIQVKRFHEYKRQHLNILNAITIYNRIKSGVLKDPVPRTIIFGGKAAPGYWMAKLIIKLINSVGETVKKDPDVNKALKIVFYPDFNVKNAQRIYPAADLSEQISTAGYEASGTGNMKFALNGALTIGTLDGANIEIMEKVGRDNFFLFGLTAEEVARKKREAYRPRSYYETDIELRQTLDMIAGGAFSNGDKSLFDPLVSALLDSDPFMVMADYRSYIECQAQVSESYRTGDEWARKSIINVSRMGKFSSDRAVKQYTEDIWHVAQVKVK